jgi:hypothetical protein
VPCLGGQCQLQYMFAYAPMWQVCFCMLSAAHPTHLHTSMSAYCVCLVSSGMAHSAFLVKVKCNKTNYACMYVYVNVRDQGVRACTNSRNSWSQSQPQPQPQTQACWLGMALLWNQQTRELLPYSLLLRPQFV